MYDLSPVHVIIKFKLHAVVITHPNLDYILWQPVASTSASLQ